MPMPITRSLSRPVLGWAACACLAALSPGFSGCRQPASPRQEPAGTSAADDHAHDADHGHDHAAAGHDHGAGPHGGTLAD